MIRMYDECFQEEKIRKKLARIQKTHPDYIEHINLWPLFDEEWIYGSAIDTENEKEIRFKVLIDNDRILIKKV